jgi:hypothetical protein
MVADSVGLRVLLLPVGVQIEQPQEEPAGDAFRAVLGEANRSAVRSHWRSRGW